MKFLEFQQALKSFPAFSYQDIIKIDPSFDRRRLVEWQAKKYILKIRKGYYCFPRKDYNENYLMLISNRIYKPSYISLATALSYYNLIPEAVYLFTGISTRKTMYFETPLGNFEYHRLKKELFFGYRLVQFGEYSIRIADMEKALLDFFYLNKINTLPEVDGLRLNRLIARELLVENKLMDYLTLYDSESMNRRIKLLLDYLNAES
jgi:predicted transcriptional regulator of viral defense system